MSAALWTNSVAPPPELQELWLCRDIYKCAPSVLDEQDAERILTHVVCINSENKVREAEYKHRGIK